MNILLVAYKLIYALFFVLFYGTWCFLHDSVKFFIPYKWRSKSVKNEIVLITGAGSGLGKSLAKKLAKLGATLVLWDLNEDANNQTRDEINQTGGKAYSYKCDVSNRLEIYSVARKVQQEVGNVTVLVNNAGIVTGKKFLDSKDELIEKTMQVNTTSMFWTTKAFLPYMLETNHGHVVTVASVAGIFGVSGLCDYCASKFGAVGFDDSLRNELSSLGKTGIHTTVVCPYYINTGMFDGVNSSLVPILEQEYVTDKMLEAILTNQQILMLPRAMYFLAFAQRLLPVRVYTYAADHIFETNSSMDKFRGRKKTN